MCCCKKKKKKIAQNFDLKFVLKKMTLNSSRQTCRHGVGLKTLFVVLFDLLSLVIDHLIYSFGLWLPHESCELYLLLLCFCIFALCCAFIIYMYILCVDLVIFSHLQ